MHETPAVASDPDATRGSADTVSAIVLGLGPVGQGVLRAALNDPRFDVRACVDPRPDRDQVGRQAGFLGDIHATAEDAGPGPGLAILCTSSTLEGVAPTIRTLLGLGYDVVTSCEEMIAPHLAFAQLVHELDDAALHADRTVLGAGVNPGFVMDLLPLIATVPSREVREIRLLRRVDVATRRQRLQEKVGMGISLDEFSSRREAGTIGHVGLRASLAFVAHNLGWHGDSDERVEPVVDSDGATSRGVRHIAQARDAEGAVRVRGLLEMYAGAPEIDQIEIDGIPPTVLSIPGGLSGDEATISAMLNVGACARRLPSGLRTLAEVPPPAWRAR